MVILNQPQFIELILQNEEIFGKITRTEFRVVFYISTILHEREAIESLEKWFASNDLPYTEPRPNNLQGIDHLVERILMYKLRSIKKWQILELYQFE